MNIMGAGVLVARIRERNQKTRPERPAFALLGRNLSKYVNKKSENLEFSDRLWYTFRGSNPGHPD